MQGLDKAQALYDRRIPAEPKQPHERETIRELDDEERSGALFCNTLEAAVELKRLNPGRIVIVRSVETVLQKRAPIKSAA